MRDELPDQIRLLPYTIDKWVLLSEDAQILLSTLRMQIAQIELQQLQLVQRLNSMRENNKPGEWLFRVHSNALAAEPKADQQDLLYFGLLANIHMWLISWEGVNKALRAIRTSIPSQRIDRIHERRKR